MILNKRTMTGCCETTEEGVPWAIIYPILTDFLQGGAVLVKYLVGLVRVRR